ncbi:MAG: TIGR04255 family protein [Planctomycetota bacterium]|nr:TIGR04255 family protein [Planctomycetota bacterium]
MPMQTPSLQLQRPPVIEVVLGVQFAPIQGLSNGHLGLFWHRLRSGYPSADDAPPVPIELESFGDDPEFGAPGIAIRQVSGDSRLRMRSDDGSRMVQIQNGWLLANWMKMPNGAYPGYSGVLERLLDARERFEGFLKDEGLPPMAPAVWEVTYVDHIRRGTVWKDWADVPKVVPGLLGSCASSEGGLRAISGSWSFGLGGGRGRMTVSLQTARTADDPATDLLLMQFSSRGPISNAGLEADLNFGQRVSVETFMSVVAKDSLAYWKGSLQ